MVLKRNSGSPVIRTEDGSLWGVVADAELIRDGERIDVAEHGAKRIVAWSGSLAESRFGDDPRTWSPAGWTALGRACEAIAPRLLASAASLCLRTHARHVLSDGPSCRRFLAEFSGSSGGRRLFEVLLDPASMLTDQMLAHAADHVARILDTLHGLAGISAIIVPRVPGNHQPDGRESTSMPAGFEAVLHSGVPLLVEDQGG